MEFLVQFFTGVPCECAGQTGTAVSVNICLMGPCLHHPLVLLDLTVANTTRLGISWLSLWRRLDLTQLTLFELLCVGVICMEAVSKKNEMKLFTNKIILRYWSSLGIYRRSQKKNAVYLKISLLKRWPIYQTSTVFIYMVAQKNLKIL